MEVMVEGEGEGEGEAETEEVAMAGQKRDRGVYIEERGEEGLSSFLRLRFSCLAGCFLDFWTLQAYVFSFYWCLLCNSAYLY